MFDFLAGTVNLAVQVDLDSRRIVSPEPASALAGDDANGDSECGKDDGESQAR